MITDRKLCLTAYGVQLRPAVVVVCDSVAGGIPIFHLPRGKKRPFQPHVSCSFFGMGALLSAVSAGVAVSAVILYHLGIIFGVFLPCKPLKNPLVLADRVRGMPPCYCIGSGTFWGGFYSFLFLPFHQACVTGVKIFFFW